ncbi:hypothetical protein ACH5RR_039647 [Cinchona calisaya]|uniref:Uncharacterized protein n=1 Tax=Cinchona calisaya TaxID=153742 RepID=A0ABD2Y462_9GENT
MPGATEINADVVVQVCLDSTISPSIGQGIILAVAAPKIPSTAHPKSVLIDGKLDDFTAVEVVNSIMQPRELTKSNFVKEHAASPATHVAPVPVEGKEIFFTHESSSVRPLTATFALGGGNVIAPSKKKKPLAKPMSSIGVQYHTNPAPNIITNDMATKDHGTSSSYLPKCNSSFGRGD